MSHEHEPHPQHQDEEHHKHLPRKAYFVAGEIVLLAQSSEAPTREELIVWIAQVWAQFGPRNHEFQYEIIPYPTYSEECPEEHPLSFNAGLPNSGDEFASTSLVHLKIPSLGQDDGDDDEDLAEKDRKLVSILNLFPKPGFPLPIEGSPIAFRGAIPNWCLAASTHSATDPGPGALPQPVIGDPPRDAQKFDLTHPKHAINASHASRALGTQSVSAQDVNVVIFDTAPPKERLLAAYDDYLGNDLLQRMKIRRDNDLFTVKYAAELGLALLPNLERPATDTTGYGHKAEYDTSDHGLFIAGLIADNVEPDGEHPMGKVSIYLVETQNNYGVGTITSLAQGISALINGKVIPTTEMSRPLVVNCSLCISFATLQELRDYCLITSVGGDFADIESAIDFLEFLEMQTLSIPLQSLQNTFQQLQIIAAAGNDSIPAIQAANPAAYKPQSTRFPAAFDFVVGVGATDKAGNRMDYSNIADVPAQDGIMTFGGMAHRWGPGLYKTDVNGVGMLGLYIGEFPNENAILSGEPSLQGEGRKFVDNPTFAPGWAWWAGTSFATAVVSGFYARAAASGLNITRGILNDFTPTLLARKSGDTSEGEPVILAPQLT